MDDATFHQAVLAALNELPEAFAQYLDNVEVLIEQRPTEAQRALVRVRPWQSLYGLYHGVPLTRRSSSMVLPPDIIYLFREPLVRDFPEPGALQAQIRRTVLHEIAHVFGISDTRLRELGAY